MSISARIFCRDESGRRSEGRSFEKALTSEKILLTKVLSHASELGLWLLVADISVLAWERVDMKYSVDVSLDLIHSYTKTMASRQSKVEQPTSLIVICNSWLHVFKCQSCLELSLSFVRKRLIWWLRRGIHVWQFVTWVAWLWQRRRNVCSMALWSSNENSGRKEFCAGCICFTYYWHLGKK